MAHFRAAGARVLQALLRSSRCCRSVLHENHTESVCKQHHGSIRFLSTTNCNPDADARWGTARWHGLVSLAAVAAIGAAVGYPYTAQPALADAAVATAPPAAANSPAPAASSLPRYTRKEVAKHKKPEDRVWVTYKDGVYDITDFLAQHPGGIEKISLAAGASVEPFWAMYQQHNAPAIRQLLEQYRIGTLEGGGADQQQQQQQLQPTRDPYESDPERHPALVVRSEKPFNAETPVHILAARLQTPNDVFYVRNHLPVPEGVDADSYRLTVEGEGLRTVQLSLQDLKTKFKKHYVSATLQCAGNRRSELKQVRPVNGLDWDAGAIGTAQWGGARLSDVLRFAGLDRDNEDVQHIHFYGLDHDSLTGQRYAVSIPVQKAASPDGDVLLAYEMNGEPLPLDHGFPVRAVVPGVVGARNCKWLAKVVASQEESNSHWQQQDYKAFPPSVTYDNVDWSAAPAAQELPVVSVICEPSAGTRVHKSDEEVTVRGYAYSGGGHDIVRVEVSSDGGKTWLPANLHKLPHQKPGHTWAWSLFEATLPIPQDGGDSLQLVCKAVDSAYNTQPDSKEAIWNLRGLLNNAWHRVNVKLEDD